MKTVVFLSTVNETEWREGRTTVGARLVSAGLSSKVKVADAIAGE